MAATSDPLTCPADRTSAPLIVLSTGDVLVMRVSCLLRGCSRGVIHEPLLARHVVPRYEPVADHVRGAACGKARRRRGRRRTRLQDSAEEALERGRSSLAGTPRGVTTRRSLPRVGGPPRSAPWPRFRPSTRRIHGSRSVISSSETNFWCRAHGTPARSHFRSVVECRVSQPVTTPSTMGIPRSTRNCSNSIV